MARDLPVYLGEPETHTIADLEGRWELYMRQNRAKEYRTMSPKDRSQTARLKARAATRYAENMIAGGTPDFVAWPMAIRSQILESESD
jgi:hypothetical protein